MERLFDWIPASAGMTNAGEFRGCMGKEWGQPLTLDITSSTLSVVRGPWSVVRGPWSRTHLSLLLLK